MFNNLLESKKKKQKTAGGTLMSFIVHATIIPLAVIATAQAAQQAQKPKEEQVDFVEVKKEEVKPKEAPPPVQ